MKISKLVLGIVMLGLLSGCASELNYGDYRGKVMLCESMNMTVHVVNGIKNNVPYVKEVVCYDKHGATWDTGKMGD